MFSEDVVLGGLKAGPCWFISDHILRMDAQSGKSEDVAMLLADAMRLRCERAEETTSVLEKNASAQGQVAAQQARTKSKTTGVASINACRVRSNMSVSVIVCRNHNRSRTFRRRVD